MSAAAVGKIGGATDGGDGLSVPVAGAAGAALRTGGATVGAAGPEETAATP